MASAKILSLIDLEIERLQQVRSLLETTGHVHGASPSPTHDRKADKQAGAKPPGRRPKRRLSAEGRARIAEAQKKRWAAIKKKESK